MTRLNHPLDKLIQTILYKSGEFEVVERPDVIWVGCVVYADNNIDPPFSDDDMTLIERYQALLDIHKQDLINPDWSAALSINYSCADKPSGTMFAQETYSMKQDEKYDTFTQPGGLWLRLLNDTNATALLNKENVAAYEYFEIMQNVAKANGYMPNQKVFVQVEYSCHTEYNMPTHRNYAYIPIVKE